MKWTARDDLFTEMPPETLSRRLSFGPVSAYAVGMGGRRSESITWQEIGNPVSEDLVTLIVVAMLTSMTIVLSFLSYL